MAQYKKGVARSYWKMTPVNEKVFCPVGVVECTAENPLGLVGKKLEAYKADEFLKYVKSWRRIKFGWKLGLAYNEGDWYILLETQSGMKYLMWNPEYPMTWKHDGWYRINRVGPNMYYNKEPLPLP